MKYQDTNKSFNDHKRVLASFRNDSLDLAVFEREMRPRIFRRVVDYPKSR